VRGAWPGLTLATAISMIGLFFTGAYTLKALWKVLHGPLNAKWAGGHETSGKARKLNAAQNHGHASLSEMTLRELVVIAPLMVMILVIGFWPRWILEVINKAVTGWFSF
jgi:NADH-quinone oxidoreductase subunit M